MGSGGVLGVRPRGGPAALGLVLLAILVAAFFRPALAEVRLSAQLDPEAVAVGEQAVLTINVEGAASVDQPPSVSPVSGLEIRGAGQSTNISIVNGRMSRSVGFQYVIFGQKPGQFTIGPFEVRDGGKLYKCDAVTLTVTGGSGGGGAAPPGAAAPRGVPAPEWSEPEPDEAGNVFVRAEVDRDHVVVGEQITLRFQFYQRMGFPLLESPQYNPPTTEGFWREDLPPQRTSTRTVRGAPYQVTELLYALFPTQSGRLEIGPGTLDCVVRDQRRSADPFSFFGGMFAQRQVRLTTKALAIRVDPLPEPRPADFTGGVGTYSLHATVDRPQAAQNDPVTLTLTVEGTGNVSTVGDPVLPDLSGFRTYPSTSDVKPDKRGDVVGGKKTFSIVVVPESTGRKEIPPVHLSIYDPGQKRYVRLESEALALSVVPARKGGEGSEGGEVVRMGRDLRTIRPAMALRAIGSSETWRSTGFWVVMALPLAVLGAAFAWRLRGERREANWGLVLSRGAPARFRREVAVLRRDAALTPAKGFDRLSEALERYLTDRFHLPVRGMTREELSSRLREAAVAEESIEQVRLTLERCDFARFAPLAQTGEDLRRTLEEASRLPEVLEKKAAARAGILPLLLLSLLASAALAAGASPARAEPRAARGEAQSRFRKGNEAYSRGDYLAAAREYGQVLVTGYESPDLFLNLGNASYKLGRLGWAVYYFERGRRLDSGDPDLKANLEMVAQETKDRTPEVGTSRFLRWLVSLQELTPLSSSLRWLAFFWWLFLLWWAARILGGSRSPSGSAFGAVRGRAGAVSGLVLGAALLGSAAWTGMKLVQASSAAGAVVVGDELPVRSNPDPEATVEFTLHAGTRVRLGREVQGFREVLFSDKLRGWGAAQDLADLRATGTSAIAPADVETSFNPTVGAR
jgi:tetratricopeptide (TPR) repeat protein